MNENIKKARDKYNDYFKEIHEGFDKWLLGHPEYIEFNPPIEEGTYECVSWLFGAPNFEKFYCDGYQFVCDFPDGSWWTEKVSHYKPVIKENSI